MKKKTPAGRPELRATPDSSGAERERGIRLNKLLADNGIASRRRADVMITEGAVLIDGQIVTELGRRVDPDTQRIEVDGVVLRAGGDLRRYYLLNKPAGVVCTNDTHELRPRAVDLITDRKKGRIYTVGRLDEETVGLVILTNDGEFANHVSHPRYEVPKTYRVVVPGKVSSEQIRKLRGGVHLSDFKSHFSGVHVTKRTANQSVFLVILNEGRNREIRRSFANLGLPVRHLRRVAIGGIDDRGLKIGHWRPLTRSEVEGLRDPARSISPAERLQDQRYGPGSSRGSRRVQRR